MLSLSMQSRIRHKGVNMPNLAPCTCIDADARIFVRFERTIVQMKADSKVLQVEKPKEQNIIL